MIGRLVGLLAILLLFRGMEGVFGVLLKISKELMLGLVDCDCDFF